MWYVEGVFGVGGDLVVWGGGDYWCVFVWIVFE